MQRTTRPMRHLSRFGMGTWAGAAPLAVGLAAPRDAAAQGSAAEDAPSIEVSEDELDFGDADGGTLEVTIGNAGSATLHIHEVRVIEEGFDKRAEHARKTGKVGAELMPVFAVSGLTTPAAIE